MEVFFLCGAVHSASFVLFLPHLDEHQTVLVMPFRPAFPPTAPLKDVGYAWERGSI